MNSKLYQWFGILLMIVSGLLIFVYILSPWSTEIIDIMYKLIIILMVSIFILFPGWFYYQVGIKKINLTKLVASSAIIHMFTILMLLLFYVVVILPSYFLDSTDLSSGLFYALIFVWVGGFFALIFIPLLILHIAGLLLLVISYFKKQ